MSFPFDYVISDKGKIIPKLKKKKEYRIEDFFDVMKWRIDHDRSNIIIIVGEQGSGKSNTGLYLTKKCNQLFYKKEFDFDTHIYNVVTYVAFLFQPLPSTIFSIDLLMLEMATPR